MPGRTNIKRKDNPSRQPRATSTVSRAHIFLFSGICPGGVCYGRAFKGIAGDNTHSYSGFLGRVGSAGHGVFWAGQQDDGDCRLADSAAGERHAADGGGGENGLPGAACADRHTFPRAADLQDAASMGFRDA